MNTKGQARGLAEIVGQLWRFLVSGGIVTALGVGVYWVLAELLRLDPLLANLFGYLVAVSTGYVMHSRFSFRGHGTRDDPVRTTSRFLVVSLISLGLNSFWVWLFTDLLEGPTWWPMIPMLAVTPLVTFSLNRKWVFA